MASLTLLDEWNSGGAGAGTLDSNTADLASLLLDDSQNEYPGSPTAVQKQGPCLLEALERNVARSVPIEHVVTAMYLCWFTTSCITCDFYSFMEIVLVCTGAGGE
jgi:hypothetical protein